MSARTPFEYPLEAHAADAVDALGWDGLACELAREAEAFLDAHDALREVRSSRYAVRLTDYLRATKPKVTHFDGPA